jgi:NADH-quinone oxidoreductase subunit G
MPKVTIDNQVYEFEGRPKALQLCLDKDHELPHFCYHPAMSAPANCRQCLIKAGTPAMDRETRKPRLDDDGNPVIQYFPKLMTSCSMDVTDGMVIHTHRSSEEVAQAQKDNLELLLINHPLDCPICDQAGHCPLQIQAYKYGPEGSRFEFTKVHKPKHVRLGPRVMLDGERCINCTRCVRFTDEISMSHQLTIIGRGVKNYPMTPPGTDFDEPYSMNVIDICPVGALTSIDFRFKSRIWEMSKTPSITTTNAKGSNCDYWVKDNLIMKVTPRQNMAVNAYWLADEDRLDYERFNKDRPNGPTVNGESASWEAACDEAARLVRGVQPEEVLFLGSPFAPVEDNYLLVKLATALGAVTPQFMPRVMPGVGDGWLRTDDRTPNTQGCERLGMQEADPVLVKSRIASGEIKLVYVLQDDPVAAGLIDAEALEAPSVILHHFNTTNRTLPHANVTLPAATIVETVGTFVNVDGHAQRVRPAKAIRGISRTLAMEMGQSRADRHGTPFDRWHTEENLVDCRPGWLSLPEVAERLGFEMTYKGPMQIMEEVSGSIAAFDGATYDAMGLLGVHLSEVGAAV